MRCQRSERCQLGKASRAAPCRADCTPQGSSSRAGGGGGGQAAETLGPALRLDTSVHPQRASQSRGFVEPTLKNQRGETPRG